MQHIGVVLEDERHKELSRLNINFADVLSNVWKNTNRNEYPWIWSIDPYGLTVFNLNQIPYLRNELKIFAKGLNNEGAKIVDELVSFIGKLEQHTYLVFIGD